MLRISAVAALATAAVAFLPSTPPPWASTWNSTLSTLTMACNSSGWFDIELAKTFGIVSYDWSNAKAQWAKQHPMDCEERLIQQAQMTKAASADTRVFIYQNLVKALPWFSTVREKLTDPAYSGFFLKFAPSGPLPNGSYHVPQCDDNYDPPLCTPFYHDQEQTPEVPTPANPNPDGACSPPTCDVGTVPVGEFLYDHRNGSMLRDFLINDIILGPNGLGNDAVDGWFLDDFWCSNIINGTGACNDPVQGPTEIDRNSQVDMGLSDEDIADITRGWLETFTAAQAAILKAGGYTWSLIPGQSNANAAPVMTGPDSKSCISTLREGCATTSKWQSLPLLFGIHLGNDTDPLPYLDQDMAAFLLLRGDYAWIGAGQWGVSWPAGMTWNSTGKPVPRPVQMDLDYGSPTHGLCREMTSGVFERSFTNVNVTLNCNTWNATYVWL